MSTQTLSPTTISGHIDGPRTRGKRDAVRDFEGALPADVHALIQDAQEKHYASHGDARNYWFAYWGRLIELRRQAYDARRRPGRYTA